MHAHHASFIRSATRSSSKRAPASLLRLLVASVGLLLLCVRTGAVDAQSGERDAGTAPHEYSLFVPGASRAETYDWEPASAPGVSHSVIGHSVEGRDIDAWRVGDGGTVLLLVGAIHGGLESPSGELVAQLFEAYSTGEAILPPSITLVAVPWANPDGFARETRLNANDVDLNRNWPAADWQPLAFAGDEEVSGGSSPLSEPETQALYDFLLFESPAFVLSYHGVGGLIEDNGVTSTDLVAADDLADAYAIAAEYEHITEWPYYEITGQFIDALAENRVGAADIEILPGDDANFERNLHGLDVAMGLLQGGLPLEPAIGD